MKTIILSAALAAFAAPSFASDQLAHSLGVEPGVYTLSQLIELKDAAERTGIEGDVYFGDGPAFASGSNAGAAQLANTLGVDAGNYSVNELARIKNAAEFTGIEGDVFLGNGPAFASTAADQLAASLGVAGQGYSLAELAQLKVNAEITENHARVVR